MVSSSALKAITGFLYASTVSAQAIGTQQSETHPKMAWKRCTGKGGSSCTNVNGEVVIDANWRWLHVKGGYANCYDGNKWNATACPDNASCTKNCEIEGADYSSTYGITTGSDSLTLKFITKGQYATNIGSRLYLMKDSSNYEMFKLIGNEFTFDVDLSQLPCGLNGALYFVSMPQKGHGTPGAKYGTGYCDAQCARDLKFVDGQANAEGWQPSSNDPNAGVGKKGACCAEMDVWEANSISTALTPHSCQPEGYSVCEDTSYYYGKGMTVDTSKTMTVVTQFIGSGSNLQEIKRFYVQGGKVIANPEPTIPGMTGNSLTQAWCDKEKEIFQEEIYPFNKFGGMASMDPDKPGIARGSCDTSSGVPSDVESNSPNAQVKFSNIKFGPIGSTFAQPASM
ncbi:exoglucanase-like protein 1 precursor [Lophiotrema nucula]|uniref:Glucanase n=1 Tax=Lophiotrema nucula TaxID=690887 RepID=A0A6A5Z2B3_9PLEO|nr:exoglucanase-like protein 1 precursor [Lophiotrema nucula]